MRMRSRRRHAGRRLLSVGAGGVGGLGPDLAHTILTITYDIGADSPLVTTAGPHGLSPAANVTISGTSVSNYNGPQVVEFVDTATTFTLSGIPYGGDATGGTWALA